MEFMTVNPFLRFADKLRFVSQRGPSKTYDCRFLYTLDGEANLEVNGTSHTMKRGGLVLFQPGTTYTIYPTDFVEMIVFDFDFTQEFREHASFFVPCTVSSFDLEKAHPNIQFTDAMLFNSPVFFENVAFLESSLHKIVLEFHGKRLFYGEKISALFKSILVELIRYDKLGKNGDTLVARIREYIEANIERPITNGEIGAYFNYNPNHLNRLMLLHTEKTLHQYVMEQRITQSMRLIQTTSMTMKEIAMSLGFNSPAHFSYCFKKVTGASPMEFREE